MSFLLKIFREVAHSQTFDFTHEVAERFAEFPDVLEYLEAASSLLRETLKKQNLEDFQGDRAGVLSMSGVLCGVQLVLLPLIYFLFIKALRRRILTVRKVLGLIPSGVLARNVKIKRYLQETSASMMD